MGSILILYKASSEDKKGFLSKKKTHKKLKN
jgi:hypothetical protein